MPVPDPLSRSNGSQDSGIQRQCVCTQGIFCLPQHYATVLNRPYVYGGTSHGERIRVIQQFRFNPALNTYLSHDTAYSSQRSVTLLPIYPKRCINSDIVTVRLAATGGTETGQDTATKIQGRRIQRLLLYTCFSRHRRDVLLCQTAAVFARSRVRVQGIVDSRRS
jgi:ERCC3/RAD25/XPB C-terminal helicase